MHTQLGGAGEGCAGVGGARWSTLTETTDQNTGELAQTPAISYQFICEGILIPNEGEKKKNNAVSVNVPLKHGNTILTIEKVAMVE